MDHTARPIRVPSLLAGAAAMIVAAAATLSRVAAAAAPVAAADGLSIPVVCDSLPNGLKTLIVRDTNVAVVSCRLYYFVGSMYEGPGTTGLSHMYEHMMFKGTTTLGASDHKREIPFMARLDSLDMVLQSLRARGVPDSDSAVIAVRKRISDNLDQQRKHIKKDEIWELYQRNGATNLNAWTADEMTGYIVTLPRNKIELFYWIEADRMRDPVLREFNSERDVVAEERRMRYDNIPVNTYWERLFALFYVAHPYRNPTIGWMPDIQAYTRRKLQDHVRRYYTPDNALIVLNGNVDPAAARKSIAQYFGSIPPAAHKKEEVVTREPQPVGQTRFVACLDAQPRIDVMFHTPGYPNDDLYRLDVLEGVLSGRSGALYRSLVLDKGLCTDAGADNAIRLHDGYFQVWAVLREGVEAAVVERAIADELSRVMREPPTPLEVLRVKNDIRMSFVSQLRSLEGLSDQLAWFQRLGKWQDLFEYPSRIAAVNPADVPATARRYLDMDKATIGVLARKQAPQESKTVPAAAKQKPDTRKKK